MALKGLSSFLEVSIALKQRLTHDSYMFRFSLDKGQTLGLPIGQHLVFKAQIEGEEVLRKYTPTSKADQVGFFEIPIKIYNRNEDFPGGGKFTQYLEALQVGDKVQVSGPRGKVLYTGKGTFEINGEKQTSQKLAFISGGTGITPNFQVIQHIVEDEKADLDLTLIYANKTEQDILLRSQIDSYATAGKLKLRYLLEKPPAVWSHSIGLVSTPLLRELVATDALVFHCGPKPMNMAVKAQLGELGFASERVIKF
mmetsp:Transcript_17300/g.31155  ORF Transcript_17300/g.31155 Transcript_17300/m.31155 type:complete len:254 (-) Transcript_17300:2752-3513(-)